MGSAPSTTRSSSVLDNVPLQKASGSTQDQHNKSISTGHPEVNKSQNGGDENNQKASVSTKDQHNKSIITENPEINKSQNGRDENNQVPSEKSTNTSDHLSIERQQALSTVTEELQKLQSHQHERTTEGKLTEDQLMSLVTAVQSYFPLDSNESYTMIHASRMEVAKKAIEYETIQIVCQYCVEYIDNNHPGERDVIVLHLLTGFLHNFSDQSPDVCKVILPQDTFMKTIKEKLKRLESTHFITKQQQKWTNTINNEDDDSTDDETSEDPDKRDAKNEAIALVNIVGTLHNISQVDDLVQSLREVGILEMTKPFLDSPNDEIRLTCLGILANIVNEDECDILVTNDNLLNFLIHVLEESMKNENRQCKLGLSIWRTTEFALTIRMMARNDNNKKSLAAHGVIPLLIKLAEGKDVKEQREAVGALWSLSFDENNKDMMINDDKCKVIDTFERLMSSEDEKVKDICRKALWTMREGLVKSTRYKSLGLQFMSIGNDEKKDGNTDGGHVMISYNRSHRPLVADIHNHIHRRQLNVWMDVNDMHGSTVDAMAKAVENAKVVLVCYSPQYKNSDNCRAEAEYAYKLKKKMLFLKMVPGYDPDGWLGFIIGSKKFYDFSGKYPFEQKLSELLKAIQLECKHAAEKMTVSNEPTLTAVAVPSIPVGSSNNYGSSIECVQNWTKAELEQWLEKNQLNGKSFRSLQGYDVAFLCVMVNECPEFFYQTIRDQLGVKDIHTMARLRFALNALNIRL